MHFDNRYRIDVENMGGLITVSQLIAVCRMYDLKVHTHKLPQTVIELIGLDDGRDRVHIRIHPWMPGELALVSKMGFYRFAAHAEPVHMIPHALMYLCRRANYETGNYLFGKMVRYADESRI